MNTHTAIIKARELLDQNGLQDWVVRYSPAVRQFGACYHRRKCILLSKKLVELNDEAEVIDTILHEIAHAIAGHKAGHGREWQEVCKKIGAKPIRCYSLATVKTPPPAFVGTCPNCSRKVTRHRRSNIACGTCCKRHNGGKFNPEYLFVWERANT